MDQSQHLSDYVLKFINQTKQSLFLTGKAGTGKTTLLKKITETTHKNFVVVAPTGIAALNAKGVTIHSFFQLPFGAFIPDYSATQMLSDYVKVESRATLIRHFKMNGLKQTLVRNLDLLIIDEVSMLRADVLDAMDFMLQTVRKSAAPFGGVQVLFIGDLQQLPPVVRQEEWEVLKKYYKSAFFFHSKVISENPILYIELEKIYRQSDPTFINILNNLRNNIVTASDLAVLNEYVNPAFESHTTEGWITVTTHNAKADKINTEALNKLNNASFYYEAEIVEDFPDKIFPLDATLELKVGSQVMFIKNDLSADKLFYNGKMAIVTKLTANEIFVRFPEDSVTIEVEKYVWENIKYTVNPLTKDIDEEIIGTFSHYPIKLAWAITVHKSQGLTFDKAALDVSQVFAPGQAYVALSRLRSLKGLVLLSPMRMNGMTTDIEIMEFAKTKTPQQMLDNNLQAQTLQYLYVELRQKFDFLDLTKAWYNLKSSYVNETTASPKGKIQDWVSKQYLLIDALQDSAQKFGNQLAKLFTTHPVDLLFIQERCQKAFDYFFPFLDKMVDELLYEIAMVRRQKKAKLIFEELTAIEELLVKQVLDLKKTLHILQRYIDKQTIEKSSVETQDISEYKINKLVEIADRIRANSGELIESPTDLTYYESDAKKEKKEKKPTLDVTLELWRAKFTVKEIADERKLTQTTIYGHLAKLIQKRQILITEIISKAKIKKLEKLFESYDGESLTELKEICGDAFTYEDLRLYKATLDLDK
ncbi:helix-turn-helix domain-containing protein [Flavobacterium agricola]|uniref:Helix-turn-helix domain-containing protein n=1 Tax=Flavobacterium agricola TaxID=2870839 RepID=A0ABY6LXW9_9FLAO|nr:helix-turn-helix domain-containing protein [Flavobacterium agricola]UYW01021.1 helix-turn-helix domain-containing protein [Flavobacterium agricola]